MLGTSGPNSAERAVTFLLMFTVGALYWGVGMSALVAWGRRFATPRLFRLIDGLCSLVLGFFGVRLLWSTFQRYGRLLTLVPRSLS
jgi:threonine/homoserine/homoserine lactone efflux protein